MNEILKLLMIVVIAISFYMFNKCNDEAGNFFAMIGFSFIIAFLVSCPSP